MPSRLQVSDAVVRYRALLYHDLLSFTQFVFRTLQPDRRFNLNWHHSVIAERLAAVGDGQSTPLIINQPPRTAKSTFCSIAFPLWLLMRHPSLEILCVSYGEELGRSFAEDSVRFITNPRVQALLPGVWHARGRNNMVATRKGGRRYTVSAGGALTGRGADVIIIDDPLKASDARTKQRKTINEWYKANIYQRLNNKNTSAILLVQQRLDVDDLSGHLLAGPEPWDHLALRAIAEGDETWAIGASRVTRKRGEALHPQQEDLERLKALRQNIGGQVFEAQYQQSPAAAQSSLLRREWFDTFNDTELFSSRSKGRVFERVVQAWDTASTVRDTSDYSVCVTMGRLKGRYYVIDVYRDKLEFPALLSEIKRRAEGVEVAWRTQRVDNVLIEDAGTGIAAIQALKHDRLPINAVKPIGDKITRLSAVSGLVESGLVRLAHGDDWVDPFLKELCAFPNVKHDDQVDAFAYALDELRNRPKFAFANIGRGR